MGECLTLTETSLASLFPGPNQPGKLRSMKLLRLILSLVFFVPAWAFLGVASTVDAGRSPWLGAGIGGVFGVICGLAFGGYRGQWLLWIFGAPSNPDEEVDR
jgi:hypothetical protein